MRWLDSPRPLMGLAPMADFTDQPFCRLLRECGGRNVIFREMLAAEAVIRGNRRTLEALEFDEVERPIVQQIFGSDPDIMARAAKLIEERFRPDGIDINMGCPVYKAVSNFNGASLMREPEKASVIVQAVKSTISVPLTVKTRLGWSRPDETVEFAQTLEQAGADAIEIHARTKAQGYAGQADWAAVRKVTEKVRIPVLINGDITDAQTARRAMDESGAQGFLIGRGALGNPWIFKRIGTYLSGQPDPGEPPLDERLGILRRHAELQIEHYGERGLIQLRKHFPWYLKSLPGLRRWRAAAVKITTLEDVDRLIADIKDGQSA